MLIFEIKIKWTFSSISNKIDIKKNRFQGAGPPYVVTQDVRPCVRRL